MDTLRSLIFYVSSSVILLAVLVAPGHALAQTDQRTDRSVYSVGDVRYGTYYNGRFGYAIAVPLSRLEPVGATDGNGQVFAGPEGELRVSGSTTLAEGSLTEAYNALSQSTPGREVTYKVERDDWFVVSGFDGDTVFYTKVMVHPESGAFLTFTIRYDRSLKPVFDPITEEVSYSFRALEGIGSGDTTL